MKVTNKQPGGERYWTNANCGKTAIYYRQEEVRPAIAGELDEFNRKIEKKKELARVNARSHRRLRSDLVRLQKAAESSDLIPCENPSRMIVFDVETTGLSPQEDEILQISIIDGDENILINEYAHPIRKIAWTDAQKINGITPEMVEDAPFPYDLIPTVKGIFQSADLLVSYNGSFDLAFLKAWGICPKDKKHVDVMREFAPIYGQLDEKYGNYKWQKLTTCAAYYGYDFQAHDSLEDVKATLYCYKKIQEEK